MQYARNTEVGSEKSRAEIELTLRRYGATGFGYAWGERAATIVFEMHKRRVKFVLPLPDRSSKEFTHTPGRYKARSPAQVEQAYEQAVRQKWRALSLVIKAKLEAVESKITVFEDEFMAHIVLPNGERVGDWLRPQIAHAYESGKMPPLMIGME